MKALFPLAFIISLLPLAAAQSSAGKTQKSSATMMVIVAHSDDAILFGSLLAHYSRQGAKVYLVTVAAEAGPSSGRPGVPGAPRGPELTRVLADETRCACRELGVESPILLEFEDGKLGQVPPPPWGYLARVRREIGKLFQQLRPDVVVTSGAEGIYGHPDHRLVGAVVTELVQSGADGAPAQLFYPGFPKDKLSAWHGLEPFSFVENRFLTVRVPYSEADNSAFKKAFACYRSQFRPDELESYSKQLEDIWGGRIYLRPWFSSETGEDLFKLRGR